jgi:putative ABC transport system substrate-binding protein
MGPLQRPGGNATGINFFVAELGAKRLGLLRELLPAATRVALLINPTDISSEITTRDAQEAARAMGLRNRRRRGQALVGLMRAVVHYA